MGQGRIRDSANGGPGGILEQFVQSEGYVPSTATSSNVKEHILWLRLVHENGCDNNPQGLLCTLCLLGKAKSLQGLDWLWRGICAIPRPLINKRSLSIATRAMTKFL